MYKMAFQTDKLSEMASGRSFQVVKLLFHAEETKVSCPWNFSFKH